MSEQINTTGATQEQAKPAYAQQMNECLSAAMKSWWESLTKEDLLQYLAEQPHVTADYLRTMLANEQTAMAIGAVFSFNGKTATANFHTADR